MSRMQTEVSQFLIFTNHTLQPAFHFLPLVIDYTKDYCIAYLSVFHDTVFAQYPLQLAANLFYCRL